jgi:hypothetical protein
MTDDISLGELNRRQDGFDKALGKTVDKEVYRSDQQGTNHRFETLTNAVSKVASDLAAERAERMGDVKDVRQEIEVVEGKQEAYEKEQQSTRSRWTLTWVGLIAAPIIGAIFALLLKGGPTTP